ncbi:MAG TPA: sialidase family protein [Terriglobia bacterium]|nr:sialidase family protein [Terriglobia bacterium]
MGAPILPGPEIHSEFIFERAPFQSCHASTLVETAQGDFLAAWFGGSHEGATDVAIWMARWSGGKWSPPDKVAFERGVPSWNPVLFRGQNNRIWLFYKFGPSPETWTGAYKISSDSGKTWSDPVRLPAGMLGPIKDKPIQLMNGNIVAGSSVESYQNWSAWVERSADDGKTWTRHGPIVIPQQPYGLIQPTLVELRPNQLRLFARSRQGFIYTADSADGGSTWTNVRPTSLLNPNSGIDCVRLKDGRILMVYNNTSTGRSPLSVAISSDGGENWAHFADLETDPGEFSYPAVIQASSGDVHITYTWKRERIKHAVILVEALK